MVKICYIADAGSIHTQRWVNYFTGRGHEVHLISWRGGEGYDEGVQLHFLTTLAPRLWSVSKYVNAVLWVIQTRRLIRRLKPDIIHAHYITLFGYLGVLSDFHPLVLSARGSDILIEPKRSFLFRTLTRYALRKADFITCASEKLKEEITNLSGRTDKIEVNILGVDTSRFSPERRDEELRVELGISGAPTIISIRSLFPIYSVDTLIHAIPSILKQAPKTQFIIIGDGVLRNYLEGLAKSLGVWNNTRFLGQIPHDELPRYLASSDIYVSTSLSDGTSISLLEAMACGLAPVVTDISANRCWVTNGENGFITPIKNPQLLTEKIIYLLKDSDTRERFRKMCRKIVKERAEYEKEMKKMEKLYESLALCL